LLSVTFSKREHWLRPLYYDITTSSLLVPRGGLRFTECGQRKRFRKTVFSGCDVTLRNCYQCGSSFVQFFVTMRVAFYAMCGDVAIWRND